MSSNDEWSSHSDASKRILRTPQRLICEDTHEQDRQKKDAARLRKLKSRSKPVTLERERAARRTCNMSPDVHEAIKSRKRVGNMSPARHEATKSKYHVSNMSPKRLQSKTARNKRRFQRLNGSDADSESSDSEPSSAVGNDARRYAKAIDDTCVFFMCAVCAWEGGLDSVVSIDDTVRDMLRNNTTLPEEFFYLCRDETESGIDFNCRRRVRIEMEEPGILQGVRHICSKCHQKAKCGKPSNRVTISFSLAGGLFCGEPPDVLKQLWAVEVSMVALVNPIVNITVLSAHAHTSSKPNSFCIENDVMQIAQKLPRVPGKDSWAVFIHQGFNGKPDSQHQYRPHYVYQALQWLKENCLTKSCSVLFRTSALMLLRLYQRCTA